MAALLRFLRSIYDLDNLDTRFTNASSVPYKTVVEARADPAHSKEPPAKARVRAQPSKWNTPEYWFYVIFIGGIVPYMFWIAYEVSRSTLVPVQKRPLRSHLLTAHCPSTASDPRYHKYERFLSDGWIPGRKIDVSDSQYHTFRQNLPFMAILLTFHPLLRKLWNVVFPVPADLNKKSAAEQGDARLEQRASFDYRFALVFLVALHGFSALKVLAILHINYQIATRLPRRHVPAATWVFNICMLFANELCEGYKFAAIARHITPPPSGKNLLDEDPFLVRWGSWMDRHGGLMGRWEILFNITLQPGLLLQPRSAEREPLEKKQLDPANLSERDRLAISAAPRDYSFRNYVAYAIYAPLYLVGPIMTYNDFISQLRHPPATIETHRTVRYAVRFLLVLLAMEVILHYDYVCAISHAGPDWSTYTPAQLSLLSFFNLHIIWLKLLLPWRLFRLWALLDGVDPPENMLRCVSNNWSPKSFWKAWHRSYNRWLIRYIYIPLGGANFRSWATTVRSIATYLLVFTFVALWHDIRLRLLIWGWLIVLFLLPEVLAQLLFPARKWEGRPDAYRRLCGLGAVANVLMMMIANLVGFAVGLDGLQSILYGILHDWSGVMFFMIACASLYMGVQIMFEIRESEMRRGISLKC
ncbi:glycerol uptake protein 1 [Colletotrichum spaethianum]|uniref:Glycerol uptake protein 1 n=1 Tax=Colletotrichum spaethianum TaxID=700344 RepID=A0AA37L784_9PEZI|nr:glycerol uptake protein 1 [Colletotrichum spaethianum]GKT43153.1 glycerol uptake protein 1 [Colletotrichum spaethianum]